MKINEILVESHSLEEGPILNKIGTAIGKGVEEFRIWDESGTYRVIYAARLKDCVAVLHAFQKKTQTTSPREVELARTRWLALSKEP